MSSSRRTVPLVSAMSRTYGATPPAQDTVTLQVPPGLRSKDLIRYRIASGEGSSNSIVTLVIPGTDLKEGDTFTLPDPASSVTVQSRSASALNAYCHPSCKFCGTYDDINCCISPVSHLRRWVCVASSPACCLLMLVIYGLAAAIMAVGIVGINDAGGEWPTLTVQGDLDPGSIYTLQGWALDEFKSAATSSLLSEEELLNEELEEELEEQVQQSQIKNDWGLLMIFRERGDLGDPSRNLLTESGLSFIKDVQTRIFEATATDLRGDPLTYPTYQDVCYKVPVNSSLFDSAEVTNETELECYTPLSPLTYYYPTVDAHLSTMYGYEYNDITGAGASVAAALVAPIAITFPTANQNNLALIAELAAKELPHRPVASFDGKGSELAPCGLNASLRAAHVAQQAANFSCIFDPYTAFGELWTTLETTTNAALLLQFAQLISGDDKTEAEINAVIGPLLADVSTPPPFCSTCYSSSCACSLDEASVQERIDDISALIAEVPFLNYLFGSEFGPDNLTSAVALYQLSFGGPLDGFANVDEGENTTFFGPPGDQTTIFNQYASSVFPILDEYGFFADSEIEVVYFWSVALGDIILDLLIHDMVLVVGSISFIFLYMWFHTRSVTLTCMGLVHIIASFPLAFFLYYYVFGIEPFYTLNFLSVYVILAIGADDVFVMVDAWNQFGHLSPAKRMSKAFARASKAMLITSVTTAGAFFATAASPLLDVSTFGLYTACLVLSNYVSVITYYLGVIMFYHLYMEYSCCCFPRCASAIPERQCCECLCSDRRRQLQMRIEDELYRQYVFDKTEGEHGEGGQEHGGNDATGTADIPVAQPVAGSTHDIDLSRLDKKEPQPPAFESFCGDKFFCVIATGVNRFIFPSILFAFTIGMAYCASQLGPTTQADAFLPSWHPVQRFIDVYNNDFGTTSEQDMKKVWLVFGLDNEMPMDRSEFGRFELEMGPLNHFQPSGEGTCDFGQPAAQQALYDLCVDLSSLTIKGETAAGDEQFLLRQASGLNELEVNCWLLNFKPWFETAYNSSFPCQLDNCTAIFAEFVEEWDSDLSNEVYTDKLVFDTVAQTLQGTMIEVNSTMGYFEAVYADTRTAYEAWDNWVTSTFADHPVECLQSAIHVAQDQDKAWVFMNTQELLISGAFTGTGVSLAVALGVLWLATGNIIVALLATLNMVCVTVCILGFMYLFGWELGTIESVSATVLVGLSVDYVVHIAQAYVDCDKVTRADRVKSALYEMGSTVFGGAITSLGASGFLFGCWLQYFFKFGGFMFLTIGLSFLFCFFFFLPLMLFAGPERTVEIDGYLYDPASFSCCCKCNGVKVRSKKAEQGATTELRKKEVELSDVALQKTEDQQEGAAVDRTSHRV